MQMNSGVQAVERELNDLEWDENPDPIVDTAHAELEAKMMERKAATKEALRTEKSP
jgi:hypothetical protein